MTMMKMKDWLTDAGGVRKDTVKKTEVGMAHFAGTGPEGKVCFGCSYLGTDKGRHFCNRYIQLTGDNKKKISGSAAACRHFQPK